MNLISLEPSLQQPHLNQKRVYCATKTVLGAFMIVSFLVYSISIPQLCYAFKVFIKIACSCGHNPFPYIPVINFVCAVGGLG